MVVTVRKYTQNHIVNCSRRTENSDIPSRSKIWEEHFEVVISSKILAIATGVHTFFQFNLPHLQAAESDAQGKLILRAFSKNGMEFEEVTMYPSLKTYNGFGDKYFPYNLHNIPKDEKVTFEFYFEITWDFPRFCRENTWDFGRMDSKLTDVALVAGTEKFHVNKATLATHSSYFYTMFFGQFRESIESEIELFDIDSETLQALLDIVYLVSDVINIDNVENLLEVARIYNMAIITTKCTKYLLSETRMLKEDSLRLAEEYGLEELKKKHQQELSV